MPIRNTFRNTFPDLLRRQAGNAASDFMDNWINSYLPAIKKAWARALDNIEADNKSIEVVLDEMAAGKRIPKAAINRHASRLSQSLDQWAWDKTTENIRKVENLERVESIPINKASPLIAKTLKTYSTRNANLIIEPILESGEAVSNTLLNKIRKDVQAITAGSLTKGKSIRTITKEIQETTGVIKSKARFWARDQLGKTYSQLREIRQREAGFPGYIWMTSLDRRVRESHARLHGQFFSWDEQTPIGVHPGEDYQCRCDAIPAFDGRSALTQKQIQSDLKQIKEDEKQFQAAKRSKRTSKSIKKIKKKPPTPANVKKIAKKEKELSKSTAAASKAKEAKKAPSTTRGRRVVPEFKSSKEADDYVVKSGLALKSSLGGIDPAISTRIVREYARMADKYDLDPLENFYNSKAVKKQWWARANGGKMVFRKNTFFTETNSLRNYDDSVVFWKEANKKRLEFYDKMIKQIDKQGFVDRPLAIKYHKFSFPDKPIPDLKKFYYSKKNLIKSKNKIKKQLNFERGNVLPDKNKLYESVVTHESGHTISDQYSGMINGAYYRRKYTRETSFVYNSAWKGVEAKAIQTGDIKKISSYATKDSDELFAESFAMYHSKDRKKLPSYIIKFLDDYLGGYIPSKNDDYSEVIKYLKRIGGRIVD